jgi:pimeloyl-ACP methyl ester carboxylesterase
MCRTLLGVGMLWVGLQTVALGQKASQITIVDGIYQRIDAKPFAGLPYRVSARVSADTAQAGKANAWIGVSVFGAKKQLLGWTKLPKNAVAKQWRVYTAEGRLSRKADTLLVTAGGYLNGPFGFDDFKLEVARRKGQWETIPLRNPGFEEAAPASAEGTPAGWRQFGPTVSFTRYLPTDSVGNHYFSTQGHNLVLYGQNAAAGQYATVNGVKLYYETYGQGEPLLLLHGNGESISSFMQQIAALAKEYQVIAVDTRDQGKSAVTRGPLSYDLFADDMQALLEQLHIPAVHVVGWSDGGNTGLSMALRYPARVRSLVTMGANLYADTTAVDAKTLKEVRQGKLLFTVLSPFKQRFRKGRRLTTMLLKYPQMQPAQLRAITAPVLVLAGEKDIIKEAHTRLLAQSIAGAQLTIFSGLTHYAPQENGPLFNQTVLNFLRTVRRNTESK